MNARNDKFWLFAALAFGLLVLPFLVHQTGLRVFGPYADGGAATFFGDFLRGLATLRWFTWLLALGPLAIVATWRGLGRLTAQRDSGD
jgi:hypothetical protein